VKQFLFHGESLNSKVAQGMAVLMILVTPGGIWLAFLCGSFVALADNAQEFQQVPEVVVGLRKLACRNSVGMIPQLWSPGNS
jgi:hypothetical protein